MIMLYLRHNLNTCYISAESPYEKGFKLYAGTLVQLFTIDNLAI